MIKKQTFYFNNTVIAPTCNYEYDSLYRLIKATGRELAALNIPDSNDFANNIPCPTTANAMQNYTQLYEYDGLGNILKMQSQGNWTRNYVYDTATNRLLKHGTGANEYDYDAQGNITAMPHLQSMTWDNFDRLKTAADSSFSAYYNYDNSGNRTRKVVIKDNIREERYYIGSYEVFRKYNNNNLDIERKTLNISDDEKVFVREETLNNTTNIRYQYDNHLGSACLELNNNAAIITYEEYHPFGTTSYRSGRSEAEVSWKRYKYCGKERDEETGLYYYGARYYVAWLGRFVSVDPLQGEQVNKTPYNYCSDNPVSRIDEDGMIDKLLNLDIENDTFEDPTKYINTKGELLYETQDELDDVIIIKNADIPIFEKKLNEAFLMGNLNNADFNKNELHILGLTPQQYTEEAFKGTGSDEWITGFKAAYDKSFDGESLFTLKLSVFMAAVLSGGEDGPIQLQGGVMAGAYEGKIDKNEGNINRLQPKQNLRNNLPIIQLNKSNRNYNLPYPGVGLPPK